MKTYIHIILNLFCLSSLIHSESWSMTITAGDVYNSGSSDYIILGMCDGCNDSFDFSEDSEDLPNAPNNYTDISFFNFDWIGIEYGDPDNPEILYTPEFYIDKRNWHLPSDLLIWNINGFTDLSDDDINIELSWAGTDSLSEEYEVILYIGASSYNMRDIQSLEITQEQLDIGYNPDTEEYITNIKILLGGCAQEGTTTYYYDDDGDGLGYGTSSEFCAGLEPDGWVDNNDDINDEIYCETNIIDECDICSGSNDCLDCNGIPWGTANLDDCEECSGGNTNHIANSDMDCNDVCFGDAEIDDCEQCSGGNTNHIANSDMDCNDVCFGDTEIDDCNECDGLNQSCLNEIFLNGPSEVSAYINNNTIELSWDQTNYPENEAILGFNIYRDDEYLASTIEEEYIFDQLNNGEFCVSAFDRYDNESNINCSIATDTQEFCWLLSDGLNLISYPILPLDATITNIFSSLNGIVSGVITQGYAATFSPNGTWEGSLTEIINYRAYWVTLELDNSFSTQEYCITGYPVNPILQYNLSSGANLISYLGEDDQVIIEALNDYNTNFTAIIGSSSASYNNSVFGWLGSLTHLERGKGYWVIVNDDFIFYWVSE